MLKVIAALAIAWAASSPAQAAYWSGYGDCVRFLNEQARDETFRVADDRAAEPMTVVNGPSQMEGSAFRNAMQQLAEPSDPPVSVEAEIK